MADQGPPSGHLWKMMVQEMLLQTTMLDELRADGRSLAEAVRATSRELNGKLDQWSEGWRGEWSELRRMLQQTIEVLSRLEQRVALLEARQGPAGEDDRHTG